MTPGAESFSMDAHHTIHDRDGLTYAVIDPPSSMRTCLALMGYGAWIDQFELQRFTLIATRLHTRIIIVEPPGLGRPAHATTWRERAVLAFGDYDPLARRMLDVAEPHLPGAQQLHLLGYSMGASLATAIAADHPHRFASLTLVEPVGFRPWRPARLVTAVRVEDAQLDTYLAETTQVGGSLPSDRIPDAPQPRRRRIDLTLLAAALCWGRSRSDLQRLARSSQAPPVMLIHGSNSALSPPADVHGLVVAAREAGLCVRDEPVAGGHGLWQSLPRVEQALSVLDDFWNHP